MQIIRELNAAERLEPCVLVPTMGSLHAGHLEMVKAAAALARDQSLPGGCVVSIFVNPSQFNEPTDFESYPRDLEIDAAACAMAGASAVFAPSDQTMYPPPSTKQSKVRWPNLPPIASLPRLEEVGRPGHFEGVCRVLVRLFDVVPCVAAVFGEKDFQQLQLARSLVDQERMPVEIVPFPTFREPDGLAMSSRNIHLDDHARIQARSISRSLQRARPHTDPLRAEAAMREVLAEAGIDRVEYATVRRAHDLMPFSKGEPGRIPGRALITAYVAGTRLLDNMPWPASPE